ncbi:MAG TPA: MarR family winged helix-turn-helix transcriptional regulator [Candidatus Limnocylindrales bacterium]
MARKHDDQMDGEAALRSIVQSLPQVAAGLKRPGVPAALQVLFTTLGPRHLPVLAYLLSDGPMSVSDLAGRLGLAMPTTSLMIRDLEAANLIERAEDPADRRRRLVRLSDKHRDAIDTWLALRTRPIQAALKRLTPAQRSAFARGMQLLAEEFSRQTPPPTEAEKS